MIVNVFANVDAGPMMTKIILQKTCHILQNHPRVSNNWHFNKLNKALFNQFWILLRTSKCYMDCKCWPNLIWNYIRFITYFFSGIWVLLRTHNKYTFSELLQSSICSRISLYFWRNKSENRLAECWNATMLYREYEVQCYSCRLNPTIH